MDINMNKFNSLKVLTTIYSREKNESFINYKLSFFSLILGAFCLIFWLIFGEFTGFTLVVKVLELLLLTHILVSIMAVINDYVFDLVFKEFFKGLWFLISLRVMIEILIF